MKNDFKVVVLDLDGTLIPKTKDISQDTINYLIGLQEKGIRVVCATGRNPKETFKISKRLRCVDFDGHMICCNGQLLHSFKEGEDIESERLPMEDAKTIVGLAKKHNIMIYIDNDEALYEYLNFAAITRYIAQFSDQLRKSGWVFKQVADRHIHFVRDIESVINKDIRKLCFAGKQANLMKFAKEITDKYQDKYASLLVSETWYEIMPKNVSKGRALEMLSEKINIPLSEFIAFGDGENDITMLQNVGWGVAMGNALDTVKSIADDVAGDNDDEAILKYLQKIGM